MSLKTTKVLSGAILVSSLLMVSVHGGPIQRIPPLQENPTIVNKDFTVGLNKDFTVGLNKDFTVGLNKDSTVGLNKDITIPVGFFPQIPALPEPCTQNGIFPVTDTCDQYYTCEDSTGDGSEWSVNWFTCPEGMLFNVDSKVCNLASSVASSRPECQKEEEEELHGNNFEVAAYSGVNEGLLKRRKRRAGATNDIVKQSEETCVVISNIDAYVRHIKSKRSLPLTSTNDKNYKSVLMGYNRDLSKAQRNCDPWRSRNGVYDKLYATYELMKAFGPKLNAKFEDHQRRVKFLSSPLLPDIHKVEKEIKTIKERILTISKTITGVAASDSDHPVLDSLKIQLKGDEQELRRLKADENRQKILKELQELKKFFEYMKNNANEIRNDALGAKVKMDDFLKYMKQDSTALNRQTDVAHIQMNNLNTQKRNNNNELSRNQRDIARLEGEIKNGNSELSKTKRKKDQAYSDLRALDRQIAKERRAAEHRRNVGAGLFAIPIFGWIAGGVMVGTSSADINALIKRRESNNNHYNRMINNYNSQLNRINNAIASDKRRVSSLEEKSRIIEIELSTIVKLNRDLRYVKENVNSIMPLLSNTLKGMDKIQTYFSGAVGNLELFITDVEKVRTEAEAKKVRHFGYISINTMKNYWNDASDKILELGKCS